MKRFFATIGAIFLLSLNLGFAQTVGAANTTAEFSYNEFHSDITINTDSSIDVREKVVADFNKDPIAHHGIYRSIPVEYQTDFGNRFNLRINNINVTDEKGRSREFSKSYSGGYLELKIGDPDSYVKGLQTYNISYHIDNATTFYKDHDELYWNLNGNKWDAPFEKASATIKFPTTVANEQLKATCYTGIYGSADKNCDFKLHGNEKYAEFTALGSRGGKINAGSSALATGENMTIVFGLPKGILNEPSLFTKISRFLADNWGYAIPLIVAITMFLIWHKKGRDPKADHDTIMPRYTAPDNLTPAEVGTIHDESVDMLDITATIIDLAVRGYLEIIENKEKGLIGTKTTYQFKKLKEFSSDKNILNFEKEILNKIFSSGDTCNLDDLKNSFYTAIKPVKTQLYERLTKNGYFPKNPETVRMTYAGFGGFLAFAMILGSSIVSIIFPFSVCVGIFISGAIIMLASRFMSVKTKKGAEKNFEILGLKEYINTAEKDRLKFQEKENIFEKLLPYAMVFGMGEKWSKAFDGILKNPPNWYRSNDPNFGSHFSSIYFYHTLNSMNSSMRSTMQSTPRASGSSGFGGGFSGGGFGGGGGGRW